MPIYELKCAKCSTKLDHYSKPHLASGDKRLPKCCGKIMTKLISVPRRDSWPEDGIFLEHASETGIHFKTKKDLQKWCKVNKKKSGALL